MKKNTKGQKEEKKKFLITLKKRINQKEKQKRKGRKEKKREGMSMSTLLLSGILSLLATASVGERVVQDYTFTSPFNNRK